MTLRIFEGGNEVEAMVALHGWLSAAEVGELERMAAAHRGALRIDLANLVGADAEGLRALRTLKNGGVRICGATPFIALLLKRTSEPET